MFLEEKDTHLNIFLCPSRPHLFSQLTRRNSLAECSWLLPKGERAAARHLRLCSNLGGNKGLGMLNYNMSHGSYSTADLKG